MVVHSTLTGANLHIPQGFKNTSGAGSQLVADSNAINIIDIVTEEDTTATKFNLINYDGTNGSSTLTLGYFHSGAGPLGALSLVLQSDEVVVNLDPAGVGDHRFLVQNGATSEDYLQVNVATNTVTFGSVGGTDPDFRFDGDGTIFIGNQFEFAENLSPPAVPGTGVVRLFALDDGGGKTKLFFQNEDGHTQIDGGSTTDINIVDNNSTAWQVRQNTDKYILVDTTNTTEVLTIGNNSIATASTNITFGSSGAFTVNSAGNTYINTSGSTVEFGTNGFVNQLRGTSIRLGNQADDTIETQIAGHVRFQEVTASPAVSANEANIYAKDVSTLTKVFIRTTNHESDILSTQVTSNDTTPDYLFNKVVGGTGITTVETNDGGDEDLTLNWDGVTIEDTNVAVTNTPHTILNFTGAGVSLADAGGGQVDITISGGGGGGSDIDITDNVADAFQVREGTNDYIIVDTLDGSEKIFFGNTTTNPEFEFRGSGEIITPAALALGAGGHGTPGSNSVAVGINSIASAANSVAIGNGCDATGSNCIAIGTSTALAGTQADAIAIGRNAQATGNVGIAIGLGTGATQLNAIAVGSSSQATQSGTVAIGGTATASVGNAIAIGTTTEATASNAVAIGNLADAKGNNAISIGGSSGADGTNAICLGASTIANGTDSIAIGQSASTSTFTDCIAIGRSANVDANGQLAFGGPSGDVTASFFGQGARATSPTNHRISATGASAANTAGGDLELACGIAKGNGSLGAGNGSVKILTSTFDEGTSTVDNNFDHTWTFDNAGKLTAPGEVQIGGDLNHDGTNVGFYGATPVAQAANITALTDSTGGTANDTVAAVSGTGDDATINDNFADLIAKINGLRQIIDDLGLMA